MAEEQKQPSESEKKKEDWMNSKWRPMMGWMYMAVCACDFMLFPVLWSLLQAVMKVGTMAQWQPLTLQGAGLFHIAMGAVLGIAAMGRTQEKIAGANNGGAGASTPGGFSVPSTPATPSFGSGMFGSAPSSATTYTPAPSWGTTPIAADASQVVSGFGGKAAPVIPPFPER
jgi:hypothetical protein